MEDNNNSQNSNQNVRLPLDMWQDIVSFLDFSSRAQLSQTSQNFREMVDSDSVMIAERKRQKLLNYIDSVIDTMSEVDAAYEEILEKQREYKGQFILIKKLGMKSLKKKLSEAEEKYKDAIKQIEKIENYREELLSSLDGIEDKRQRKKMREKMEKTYSGFEEWKDGRVGHSPLG